MALATEHVFDWELVDREEYADTSDLTTPSRVLRSQDGHDNAQQQLSSGQKQDLPDSTAIVELKHGFVVSMPVEVKDDKSLEDIPTGNGLGRASTSSPGLTRISNDANGSNPSAKTVLSKTMTSRFFLGLVQYRAKSLKSISTATTANDVGEVEEKIISIEPPTWLSAQRYVVQMRRASGGWDWKLRTYNVVPPNSPVFVHCANGETESLQSLFQSGQASPFDIDPDGNTLIHYAAAFARIDTCRLLVESGLDGDTQPSNIPHRFARSGLFSGSPLHSLAWFSRDLSPPARQQLYKQIFHHRPNDFPSHITFDEIQTLMRFLMGRGRYDPLSQDCNNGTVISTYVGPPEIFVDTFVADASQDYDPGAAAVIHIASKRYSNVTNLVLSMLPATRIDENMARYKDSTGYTLLHALCWRTRHYWLPLYPYRKQDNHPLHPCHAVDEAGNSSWREMLYQTVAHGADLHCKCMLWKDLRTPLDYLIAGFSRTEMFTRSLARYIRAFVREWLHLLNSAGIDIALYGERELECRQSDNRGVGHEWARIPGWDVVSIVFGSVPEDFDIVWSGEDNINDDIVYSGLDGSMA